MNKTSFLETVKARKKNAIDTFLDSVESEKQREVFVSAKNRFLEKVNIFQAKEEVIKEELERGRGLSDYEALMRDQIIASAEQEGYKDPEVFIIDVFEHNFLENISKKKGQPPSRTELTSFALHFLYNEKDSLCLHITPNINISVAKDLVLDTAALLLKEQLIKQRDNYLATSDNPYARLQLYIKEQSKAVGVMAEISSILVGPEVVFDSSVNTESVANLIRSELIGADECELQYILSVALNYISEFEDEIFDGKQAEHWADYLVEMGCPKNVLANLLSYKLPDNFDESKEFSSKLSSNNPCSENDYECAVSELALLSTKHIMSKILLHEPCVS